MLLVSVQLEDSITRSPLLILLSMGDMPAASPHMNEIRLMVVDPGHFQASPVQKEMYPELSKRVSV